MSARAPRRGPPAWLAAPLERLLGLLIPARGERRDGLREGRWVQPLPGGKLLSEVHYARGRRHGTETRWYLGGLRRHRGEWRDGEQTGEWYFFRRDGGLDPLRTGVYERGLRYSTIPGFNDLRR